MFIINVIYLHCLLNSGKLPDQMLEDIVHIAMPNELNKERESLEFNFTFRIDQRKFAVEPSSSSDEVTEEIIGGDDSDLLYGFVLYRQKQLYIGNGDSRTSRPICQSLVMVGLYLLISPLSFFS